MAPLNQAAFGRLFYWANGRRTERRAVGCYAGLMSVQVNLAVDDFNLRNGGFIPGINPLSFDGDERLLSQLGGRSTSENSQAQNDSDYSHTDSRNVGDLRLEETGGMYKCR